MDPQAEAQPRVVWAQPNLPANCRAQLAYCILDRARCTYAMAMTCHVVDGEHMLQPGPNSCVVAAVTPGRAGASA
jgi:hypothetical protein